MLRSGMFKESDNTFPLQRFLECFNKQENPNNACLLNLRYMTRGTTLFIWINEPNCSENILANIVTCNFVSAFAEENGFCKVEKLYIQPRNFEQYEAFLPNNHIVNLGFHSGFLPPR